MKRRILYIHHGSGRSGIGGAPLSLLYLIRRLDFASYEPVVVCLHESVAADLYRQEGWTTIAGLGVTDFAHTSVSWYQLHRFDKIARSLWHQIKTVVWVAPRLYREHKPDLVHLNTTSLLGWGIAAKLMNVPVVCHVREPLADGYLGIRKKLFQYIADWYSAAFIAICHYDASHLLPSDKIHVVYNFVNFNQFDKGIDGSGVRRELGIRSSDKMVLYLGGLSRVKGILDLLVSAEAFLGENCFLVLAGNMKESSSRLKRLIGGFVNRVGVKTYGTCVKEEINRIGKSMLSKCVITIGIRNDIPELLAACDVLVFPSTVPHFARPVIEASAMAKPSVASELGGVVELIDHGRTGVLVRGGDRKALGEAVRWLLDRPGKCREMGENAYYKAISLFDDEKNCKMIMDVYRRILDDVG